jgi:hypothetical protein
MRVGLWAQRRNKLPLRAATRPDVAIALMTLMILLAAVVSSCATGGRDFQPLARGQFAEPSEAQIRQLVDRELAASPPFAAPPAAIDPAAWRPPLGFQSELSRVAKRVCAADSDRLGCVCQFDVVLRFPDLAGRELELQWERRFHLLSAGWSMARAGD